MPNNISQFPKVFISYSWDSDKHKDDVLILADRLRNDGIDCNIDQYEVSPPEGWPHWMRNQVERSDFVLLVCTEQYQRRFQGKETLKQGKGVTWEGAIINQFIYDRLTNTKFIPVIFSPQAKNHIPTELGRFTYYVLDLKSLALDKGYEALYRHLTKQPLNMKPKLGKLRSLPPRQRQSHESKEEQTRRQIGFDYDQQPSVSTPSKDEEARQKQLTELYERARRLFRARQWKKVIDIFQQMQKEYLIFFDPDGLYRLARNELVKEREQRLRVQREKERKKQELENLYNQGLRSFQAQNWYEAGKKFEAILQREPNDQNLQRQAQEKLVQVREKLEREKWLSIGLIAIPAPYICPYWSCYWSHPWIDYRHVAFPRSRPN
ncbi:MAG: SEFIR domain-containing protein [Xenococcaceae cyanobacterium]